MSVLNPFRAAFQSSFILIIIAFTLSVTAHQDKDFPINFNNLNTNSDLLNHHHTENTFTLEKLTSQVSYKVLIISTLATISLITLTNHLVQGKEGKDHKSKRSKLKGTLSSLTTTIMDGFNYGRTRLANSGFAQPGMNMNDPEYKKSYNVAVKTGLVGGLVNDGNTCFMNSVLQSLASSNEFMDFLEGYTSIKDEKANSSDDLKFSKSLRLLLTKINGKHFNRSGYYKTKPLMRSLSNGGSNRNLIMGYEQEDAQEFYQMVLKEMEKEYVKTLPGYSPDKKTGSSPSPSDLFCDRTDDMIYGLEKLGQMGKVYVPASQIDPNFPNNENKVYPMNLVTPVDGLSAERIGCTQCGEIGGIRYSVISGISLNLQASNKNSYTLPELLNDWIAPEIIDDVECNRCGLVQMCKILKQQLDSTDNEKLSQLLIKRLKEIENELSKPIIDDEAYKRLHTKNQIQKSQKIKQIFYSRPPPLMTIHINRSVFDPRTYMIRKNGAQVNFPMKLDLSPYVAECDDINMDARLCFRKQDELKRRQEEEKLANIIPNLSVDEDVTPEEEVPERELEEEGREEESESELEKPRYDSLGNDIIYSDSSISESENDGDDDDFLTPNTNHETNTFASSRRLEQQPSPPDSVESEKVVETPIGPLTYSLKAAISHFGTHNYGHYIAYRKFRGIWWRISDETVRVTTEREVLNTSGVFMLFYELSSRNDSRDVMPDVGEMDEEEQEQGQEEEDASSDHQDSEDSSSSATESHGDDDEEEEAYQVVERQDDKYERAAEEDEQAVDEFANYDDSNSDLKTHL